MTALSIMVRSCTVSDSVSLETIYVRKLHFDNILIQYWPGTLTNRYIHTNLLLVWYTMCTGLILVGDIGQV